MSFELVPLGSAVRRLTAVDIAAGETSREGPVPSDARFCGKGVLVVLCIAWLQRSGRATFSGKGFPL